MVSFAVHLFIDAWPAGMDEKHHGLSTGSRRKPILPTGKLSNRLWSRCAATVSIFLQVKKHLWKPGSATTSISVPTGYLLKYQVEKDGKIVFANQVAANIAINSSQFQGFIKWKTPHVSNRTTYTLRAALVSEKGEYKYQNKFEFEVFPRPDQSRKKVFVLGKSNGKAEQLVQQAGCRKASSIETADVIFYRRFCRICRRKDQINDLVYKGKTVLFMELESRQYDIVNTMVSVQKTSMGDYYFVSPKTGNPLVKNFKPFDFRLWYSGKEGLIKPILAYTFSALTGIRSFKRSF